MGERKEKFDREYATAGHREVWLDRRKWKSLFDFVEREKGKIDTVVIRAPEVLGDTYREFVLNLAMLGDAGMKVEVRPSAERGESMAGVSLDTEGQRHLIFERQDSPFITNGPPKPAIHIEPRKSMIVCFQTGNPPAEVIESRGPDENYCKAELLLKFERERHKPSNKGRAITGFYILGGGTIDDFLYPYRESDIDLAMIEQNRLAILKRGWDSFVVRSEDAKPFLEGALSEREET
jgi:hypothetical protein